MTSRLSQSQLRRHRLCCLAWMVNARRWGYGSTLSKKRSRASTLRRKSRSPPKMVQHSLSERTFSTLTPLSAPCQEGISLESTPRLEVHRARRPQKDYSMSGFGGTHSTLRLDGCYTRMLRMVLNVSWKDRVVNKVLYGDLPYLSFNISRRRLRLAGHYIRHSELVVSGLVLCEPTQ